MPPTFRQVFAQSQYASGDVVLANPTLAHSCILAHLAQYNTGGGGIPATITDTQGDVFQFLGSAVGVGGNWEQLFVAADIIGGASTTVHNNNFGFGTFRWISVVEYTGVNKANPVRSSGLRYQAAAGDNPVPLSAVTVGDLIVLFSSGNGVMTAPAGYTARVAPGAGITEGTWDNPASVGGPQTVIVNAPITDTMAAAVALAPSTVSVNYSWVV